MATIVSLYGCVNNLSCQLWGMVDMEMQDVGTGCIMSGHREWLNFQLRSLSEFDTPRTALYVCTERKGES